jgi:hypothetical protein
MNNETSGGRSLRTAATMAVAAAVVTLATGCGVVHVHFGSSGSAQRTTYRDNLPYAQCMRSHGLPGFPDPGPSGTITFSGQLTGDSPAARANAACEHLLPADS